MSQIIHSLDFLLQLKAGELKVLVTRQPDSGMTLTDDPRYRQAHNAIKRLNYNQKGNFELVLRSSRDGLRLAAVCVFDGVDRGDVPEEYRRAYRRRTANRVTTPNKHPPLSKFMHDFHAGRPVEVFVAKRWRPVEPDDWVSVSPENFRTRRGVVVAFWDSDDPDACEFRLDPSEENLKAIRAGWEHVRMFYEEEET